MSKNFPTVNFSSRYVASLFDCNFSNQKIDKKKFKDLSRAGHIISKLYIVANDGSKEATNVLNELADWYKVKAESFQEAIEKADKKAVFLEEENKGEHEAKLLWDNKLFLGIVDMLRFLDSYSIALERALDKEIISKKQLMHFRKSLANPPRSVINKVFEVAKQNHNLIFQS